MENANLENKKIFSSLSQMDDIEALRKGLIVRSCNVCINQKSNKCKDCRAWGYFVVMNPDVSLEEQRPTLWRKFRNWVVNIFAIDIKEDKKELRRRRI